MSKKLLPAQAFRKLAALYAEMQDAYSAHAQAMGLTCDRCEDNCCTSYFQHHTRIEWAYLLRGLGGCPKTSVIHIRTVQDGMSVSPEKYCWPETALQSCARSMKTGVADSTRTA